MIIVKPNGGLGNRMRVIHSAIILSKLNGNEPIKILWRKYGGINADFSNLFLPIDGCTVEQNLIKSGLIFYFLKEIRKITYLDDRQIKEKMSDKEFWIHLPKSVLINSSVDFLHNNEIGNFYRLFCPVELIQGSIDSLVALFNEYTVGVQVRRTGSRTAIKKRNLDDFVLFMNREINKHPDTNFFLATDDIDSEIFLKKMFPDKIITQENKELSRNSLEGISSAVVDMYALGHTRLILGSYYSSFGEVASYLKNIPLVVVKEQEAK